MNSTIVNSTSACGSDCAVELAGILLLLAFCGTYCNMQILVCGFACCTLWGCLTWVCNISHDLVIEPEEQQIEKITNPLVVVHS